MTEMRVGATPGDRENVRSHLVRADQLLSHAIESVRGGDAARAAELVGRSSDQIGSALYHLRLAMRAGATVSALTPGKAA